jgi:hypothetical protein
MSWGFEVGRVYNRRADIHAKFGGQQQGGIITPAEHALVFIITGEEGGTGARVRRSLSPRRGPLNISAKVKSVTW